MKPSKPNDSRQRNYQSYRSVHSNWQTQLCTGDRRVCYDGVFMSVCPHTSPRIARTHTHRDTHTRAHTATHTQTRTHRHTHRHTRTHRYTRAHTHRHTHTDTHAHTHTDTHAHTQTRTHTAVNECVFHSYRIFVQRNVKYLNNALPYDDGVSFGQFSRAKRRLL